MKKFIPLNGNSQKLDAGAMYGHVPKALWSRWTSVDEHNRMHLACRALLIEDNQKRILLETGIGAFFSPKYKERYGVVEQEHILLSSLDQHGFKHTDIDIVILSHLHFDHAGGLLSTWQADQPPTLLFPNATYLTSHTAWERACHPHTRDNASFIPELNSLLKASGRLQLIDNYHCEWLGDDYQFHFSDGHTPGMMLTEIKTIKGPLIFAADLIPGTPWVHLPITMGYDRFPESIINEKQTILDYLLQHNGMLFYTHDPQYAWSHISKDQKGNFAAKIPTDQLTSYIS